MKIEPPAFALYMLFVAPLVFVALSVAWAPLESWIGGLFPGWLVFWIGYLIGAIRQAQHTDNVAAEYKKILASAVARPQATPTA